MNKFCRIFETVKHGQILCRLRKAAWPPGQPCIEWTINVGDFQHDGIEISYENTEQGWEQAKAAFEQFDTEMAYRVADVILKLERETNDN